MLRIFSRIMVKLGKMNPPDQVRSYQLVKPVRVILISDRYLNQQKGLPRVPVPPLRKTCEGYLSALEPIIEEDEWKRAKQLVEAFMKRGGVGEELQRSLERKACNTDNWTTDLWGKLEYFGNRSPVVINANVPIVCPRLDFRDKQGQIRCAAKLIVALLEFKTTIENETLPAENLGGKPLCMEQYSQLLSTCRIPGLERDSVVFHAKIGNPPKHITVVYNSQFFVVEVYHNDGTPLTVDQLCVQMESICTSTSETNTEPVGILTTLDRDSWSKAYLSMKDQTNKESLSAIERSIFTLCLDRAIPRESDKYGTCDFHLITHGGGSQWNSANRWFDKSLQIIVAEDGSWGLNLIHIVADGTVSMALTDYLVASMKKPEMRQASILPLPMPQKLHFHVTPDIKEIIEQAKRSMDRNIQNFDLSVLVFDHFGKNYLKAHNMSPDAFIQMAIQLAYYRMNKQVCASYEAVSQRMFRRGRVSLLLSTTSVSAAFVKAFDDPQKQNTEKIDLLEKAIKTHKENIKAVIGGHDIVAHIIALRLQAVENKLPMPDIFRDISYKKILNYQFAASQVTSNTGSVGVHQVDENSGYSLCYSVHNSHFIIEMATFNTHKRLNTRHLIQNMKDALLDMRALLEQAPRAT
ncbi:carnitine O-acetyltransferase-like isoform X1 [Pundamilia nyererei]|uniref:Carnitine O-acetyltransferase-like isoform X1 n=1 Tax=Pundamilia nyererei TaxID=303518 RepID=A0A9Y3S245_9CICH|nr:PREDICTED: carnitine O-acetyltransferase-like isoform X1 [Pundamilia nyererei]